MKRKMKKTILVAAFSGALGVAATAPVRAQYVVYDPTNFAANTLTQAQTLAMQLKQVDEYVTQLAQYANQLQNTKAPLQNIWDQIQSITGNLLQFDYTIGDIETNFGGMDKFLSNFHDITDYSSCFSLAPADLAAQQTAGACGGSGSNSSQTIASKTATQATQGWFKSIEQQQKNLTTDSQTISDLQSAAQDADGQLEAIGYTNQIASEQATQLMQIRALMLAQQKVEATRQQGDNDRKAQASAADAQLLSTANVLTTPTPESSWTP